MVIIPLLLTLFIYILFIPTIKEQPNYKESKRLNHCDQHEWENRPNNVDDGVYTICKKCKFLPESNTYSDFKE